MNFNLNKYIARPFSHKEVSVTRKLLKRGLDDAWKINGMFEEKFSQYMNCQHTLACSNGTAAMEEALWACGIKEGDEVVAPAMTYWASVFPAFILGAKIQYADIDPNTLCIDPYDIEKKITKKTKAIIVVHLYGHPCDMDRIISLAHKYGLKVIEDFSHAHGALYKGKKCGTIGDVGIASCMGEKAFYLPEGGVLCTNSDDIFEKACLFGHYRYIGMVENSRLEPGIVSRMDWNNLIGAPLGAVKDRMNPVSALIGIERLKHFERDMEEMRKAMLLFIKRLEESGYYYGHIIKEQDSSMGGWYSPVIFSKKNAQKVAGIVRSKGYNCQSGHRYFDLSTHPMNFKDFIRENIIDVTDDLVLKVQHSGIEDGADKIITIPRFTRFNKRVINKYADLYIKAAQEV
ncbi:aminotransferase class V-fold PLP-dependent enzyme [Lactococcus lactis subsp. lactis KLDS 4.0325]|uniref:DegT/DnrJ/EryC1/StrS family aminotransferase n=1 Tax=Lactococcus cremoris subsp. cremoris TIFN6 TaxID=1234876 RepID=T0TRC3_LACLC|nr:aminotransferase class V-fold PLP-dependent enzyme [Lactococcus lactis]AGY45538.1 aminotransferase class V-fold PLP-dependent enzyme [Lactococcus lactis subsp. lactis KLDS 4.0325]EQC58243.1 hypothetical protein LLT6_09880 [Lactococcus cremoris subsp. cremoris TIFN6]OJH47212.1 hypothetical protein LGL2_06315 [Lactococcus lactis subsp. lactis bv. diacetylactis]TRW69668.1 aminotransferase class V-fold PLP-dependent enzyme [Lactococcus lactis]